MLPLDIEGLARALPSDSNLAVEPTGEPTRIDLTFGGGSNGLRGVVVQKP